MQQVRAKRTANRKVHIFGRFCGMWSALSVDALLHYLLFLSILRENFGRDFTLLWLGSPEQPFRLPLEAALRTLPPVFHFLPADRLAQLSHKVQALASAASSPSSPGSPGGGAAAGGASPPSKRRGASAVPSGGGSGSSGGGGGGELSVDLDDLSAMVLDEYVLENGRNVRYLEAFFQAADSDGSATAPEPRTRCPYRSQGAVRAQTPVHGAPLRPLQCARGTTLTPPLTVRTCHPQATACWALMSSPSSCGASARACLDLTPSPTLPSPSSQPQPSPHPDPDPSPTFTLTLTLIFPDPNANAHPRPHPNPGASTRACRR